MRLLEDANGLARDVVRAALVRLGGLRDDPTAALFAGDLLDDPYPVYARVRAHGRLVRTPYGAITADHGTCDAILRDPATRTATAFRAETSQLPPFQRWLFSRPDLGDLVDPLGVESMIGLDGAEHARLRRLVSSVFTPSAVARLRPQLRAIVERLVDEAVTRGRFDLMSDVAGVFPVLAICEVLGIPTDDHERFKRWGTALASDLDAMPSWPAQRRAATALAEMSAYLTVLADRRRRDPGDDLVSQLALLEQDGDQLTDRELLATWMLLLVAGFETTVNLLGNGTLALLRHPEQLLWLRDDLDRVAGAVEELLRYDAPVQFAVRFVGRPMETTHGALPPGSPVTLLLGGANRDPAVFDRPDELDLARPAVRRHLAFASGPHYCLGAALARLEGELAFRALLERTSYLRLADRPRHRRTVVLRGLESLPIVAG